MSANDKDTVARQNEKDFFSDQEKYLIYLLAHLKAEDYPENSRIQKVKEQALKLQESLNRQDSDSLIKDIQAIEPARRPFRTRKIYNRDVFALAAEDFANGDAAFLIKHLTEHLEPKVQESKEAVVYDIRAADSNEIGKETKNSFVVWDHSLDPDEGKRKSGKDIPRSISGGIYIQSVKLDSTKKGAAVVKAFENKLPKRMHPKLKEFLICNFHQDSLSFILGEPLQKYIMDTYGYLSDMDRTYFIDIAEDGKSFRITYKVRVCKIAHPDTEHIVHNDTPFFSAEQVILFDLGEQDNVRMTRESFKFSGGPCFVFYSLHLIPDDAVQQMRFPKGENSVVLTNSNEAYLVINGQLVLDSSGNPQCIKGINRNGIRNVEKNLTLKPSDIAENAMKSSLEAIICEAILRGGHSYIEAPQSFCGGAEARDELQWETISLEQQRCIAERNKNDYPFEFNEAGKWGTVFERSDNVSFIDIAKDFNRGGITYGRQSKLPTLDPEVQKAKEREAKIKQQLGMLDQQILKARGKELNKLLAEQSVLQQEWQQQLEIIEVSSPQEMTPAEELALAKSLLKDGLELSDNQAVGFARSIGQSLYGYHKRLMAMDATFAAGEETVDYTVQYSRDYDNDIIIAKLHTKTDPELRSTFHIAISELTADETPEGQARRANITLVRTEAVNNPQKGFWAEDGYHYADPNRAAHFWSSLDEKMAQNPSDNAKGKEEEEYTIVEIKDNDRELTNEQQSSGHASSDGPNYEVKLAGYDENPTQKLVNEISDENYYDHVDASGLEATFNLYRPVDLSGLRDLEANGSNAIKQFGVLRIVQKNGGELRLNREQVIKDIARDLGIYGKSAVGQVDPNQPEEVNKTVLREFGLQEQQLDAVSENYQQGAADAASHLGNTVGDRIPGILTVKSLLSSGSILPNFGTVSVAWGLCLQVIDPDEGIKNIAIPGEVFITTRKHPEGGFEILSIRASNQLLQKLLEHKSGEALEVYGYDLMGKSGELNQDNLILAINNGAKPEELLAQRSLRDAMAQFREYGEKQEGELGALLKNIPALIERHRREKGKVYKGQNLINGDYVVTLDTAMAATIYRDVPLVLAGKKSIEHCPLLLKAIVWCGDPELSDALKIMVAPKAGGLEELNRLLDIYGSGDEMADFAQAYQAADEKFRENLLKQERAKMIENLEAEMEEKIQQEISFRKMSGEKEEITEKRIDAIVRTDLVAIQTQRNRNLKEEAISKTSQEVCLSWINAEEDRIERDIASNIHAIKKTAKQKIQQAEKHLRPESSVEEKERVAQNIRAIEEEALMSIAAQRSINPRQEALSHVPEEASRLLLKGEEKELWSEIEKARMVKKIAELEAQIAVLRNVLTKFSEQKCHLEVKRKPSIFGVTDNIAVGVLLGVLTVATGGLVGIGLLAANAVRNDRREKEIRAKNAAKGAFVKKEVVEIQKAGIELPEGIHFDNFEENLREKIESNTRSIAQLNDQAATMDGDNAKDPLLAPSRLKHQGGETHRVSDFADNRFGFLSHKDDAAKPIEVDSHGIAMQVH